MHKYKHKMTGAIISTNCVCSGEGWEEISQPSSIVEPPEEPKEGKKSGRKKTACKR